MLAESRNRPRAWSMGDGLQEGLGRKAGPAGEEPLQMVRADSLIFRQCVSSDGWSRQFSVRKARLRLDQLIVAGGRFV